MYKTISPNGVAFQQKLGKTGGRSDKQLIFSLLILYQLHYFTKILTMILNIILIIR